MPATICTERSLERASGRIVSALSCAGEPIQAAAEMRHKHRIADARGITRARMKHPPNGVEPKQEPSFVFF
jgi:hypothetical protein